MVESSKFLPDWRRGIVAKIIEENIGGMHFTNAVKVEMVFSYQRPASHFGTGRNAGVIKRSAPFWKKTRPDLSKLVRAVEDAMVDSGLLHDDGQIAILEARKSYDRPHGVKVTVWDV